METGTGSVIGDILLNIFFAAVIVIVGRTVVSWLVKLSRKIMVRANIDPILINFSSSIINILLLLFVLIAALDQLGVNTTSMIAVLGAAGLAVGLALKDSLQNFAAGVMLIMYRPFRIGHFVEVAGVLGIVEQITIFNTVMRTPDNREVIVPNGNIYAGVITNYSARDTRRIDMVFGIGYDDDLLKAKQIITDIVTGHELVLNDPEPIIRVAELGDSSITFNVWPWVNASDLATVRADLIETIKLAFDANGISIPYPQMDVHFNNVDAANESSQTKKDESA
ncbi:MULTISPECIES: mechanosensitive ion channel domain-containing protein [unclassified Methylophaga]|jgi:small conductance mechanosensitive channel|uniref:mechanosensitive ion channel family protein n=1 Tax=unclassified Methylophaga TaxID=2629249 RepID=UPI000C64DB68|nr:MULTISPECIES: mechanosensitive ion channel domain-containing protein [unclassified Methylophaga]MAL48812.1 mechanosensitive ion channel protein MscS [Methylophaga sp.]MBP26070.1 mechanosensitive ion channel protein MscS [Methylophaga sp.]|tara:strand:+ start:9242 stop:10084 length:843 start_codon:yes stop_codon:yes gene_type:complete